MNDRWQNQEEAMQFALSHSAVMLDMDMGTGKTRVAIDTAFAREDIKVVLVVCPKSVLLDRVWEKNLNKFQDPKSWVCLNLKGKESVPKKTEKLKKWISEVKNCEKKAFITVNYDIVWRKEMGDFLYKEPPNMIILDESHRAKSAGSKVSKYLAMLGRRVKYKMCLSGTPMANSPLDVYGQYRFLDPTIFGTNHGLFLQEYAIMGGPDLKFVVGYKNQKLLQSKFQSIAYTCKMSDVADRIKLPNALPPITRYIDIPEKDLKTMKELTKEFIAECGSGHVVVNNVLVKLLRLQQITSGFCFVKDIIEDSVDIEELNTSKQDGLVDILTDLSPLTSLVVFCRFRHDIASIRSAAKKSQRKCYELSGSENTLEEWKKEDGAVIAVQIQAGSEGVDMTKAHHAVYYTVPTLTEYEQSRARLYRPGQKSPVSFIHLIARNTIDTAMYNSLMRKENMIDLIKSGNLDFGYIH